MRYILTSLFFILFAQHTTAPLINSNVLLRGCELISSNGRCYNLIQDSPIKSWIESQSECTTYEQDLASFSSSEEVALVDDLLSNAAYYWIGLNDIDVEGSYVWVDGSDSEFTSWNVGNNEPDSDTDYNCVLANQHLWGTYTCTRLNGQHACSSTVSQIGHRPEGIHYRQLMDNSTLNINTTLICITELYDSSQVQWEYVELDGTVSVPSTSTDAKGISELAVTLDNLGSYSCSVTQNGGALTVKFTVILVNTTLATTQATTLPTDPSTQMSTQSVNATTTVNATMSVVETTFSSYSSETILLSVIMVMQFVIIMSMMFTGLVSLYIVRIRVIG